MWLNGVMTGILIRLMKMLLRKILKVRNLAVRKSFVVVHIIKLL